MSKICSFQLVFSEGFFSFGETCIMVKFKNTSGQLEKVLPQSLPVTESRAM